MYMMIQYNQVKKQSKRSPKKLEDLILKTENEISKLKESQFLEENYMDYKKMAEIEKKIKELENTLSQLEEEYLSQ